MEYFKFDLTAVIFLHLAMAIKFLFVMKRQRKIIAERGEAWDWSKYKHDRWLRWAIHYLASWTLTLLLPNAINVMNAKGYDDYVIYLEAGGPLILGLFAYDIITFIDHKFWALTHGKAKK